VIASYKRNASIAAVVWLAAIICETVLIWNRGKDPWDETPLGFLLFGIYIVAVLLTFWWYIKAKGRSGNWILMLAFHVIGLIVILLLKDRAKDGQPPAPPAPHEWFG